MPPPRETADFTDVVLALPIPALLLRPDAPRFSIAGASQTLFDLVGMRPSDLLGKGLFEMFQGHAVSSRNDGPESLNRSLQNVIASGRVDRMPMVRYDLRSPLGSLEERYWIATNAPLRDADGNLRFILHLTEDVTELAHLTGRHAGPDPAAAPACDAGTPTETRLLGHVRSLAQANEYLARRNAELSAVLDQTPLFQGLVGLDGTFLRGNDLTFRATGWAAAGQLGRKFWDNDWWEPSPRTQALVRDTVARVASGETVRWQHEYRVSNGPRRLGDFTFSPIRDASGKIVMVCANGRDCTDEERTKAELAAAEQRHRSLLSNLPGIAFRAETKRPWRLLYASEGIERLSGFPVSHFVDDGNSFQSIMVDEDVERVAAEVAAKSAAGESIRTEYRIRHRDGSVRWVEGHARLSEESAGTFDGTVFDIDDRKRAEQALHESREHFHYTTQNAPCVLWTALPDGGLDFVSDASTRELGTTPGELLKNSWLAAVHPDDVQPTLERWGHSLATGELYDAQFRMRDARGEFRSFHASAQCRREPNGRIVRWYGVLNNVDELVRVQARLRESEELAHATLQTVPGIVWRAAPDGAVDFVSDACTAQLGLTPAQIITDQWRGLVHPDDLEAVSQRYAHSIATGADYESRHRFRHASGAYHWYQLKAIASRDAGGRIQRWYGLATDIEEVLQARFTAETAARAKSAFLATMSHEIRTPLNAVLGFAGLLAETELGHQQRDFVNSIRASGDHLLGVINDILDFSKLESGSLALDFAPCELRELVESAVDLVASQAASKRLELVVRMAEDMPSSCLADGARLRQVLVNLLSNAVKFTVAGEVEIKVSSRSLGHGEHEFEFRVRDSGPGISAEGLTRLFRDFSQVDDSIARRFGGSGLGLAISKRLVEAHGGVITVQSQLGSGSTFHVRIPARACEGPRPAVSTTLRGRRVLVVDDHRNSLDSICAQLQTLGIEVTAEQDPLHAQEIARLAHADGRPFHLALLDQHMAAMDGVELARRLLTLAPLPVVLMTSLGTTLSSIHAGRGTLTSVLTKPVHRSALLDALHAALEARPASSETPTGPAPAMPALRLLLVEDNAVNRKLALLLLRKLGYTEVDVAVDGVEALEAVRSRVYDIALMDVQMPNLDGLEATRRIRREVDAAHQPQIVAMTANALMEDREACLGAGMDAYVAKPITAAQLTDALLRAAERLGKSATTTAIPAATGAREEAEARAAAIADQVLAGGGEMAALMRRIDWSQNPLGPIHTWPQSLRTVLSIVLTQKHPMFVFWGPELIQFYNDAYRPILGRDKHPAAMGQRGRDCWPDIWDTIGPMVQAARERGESTIVERGLLCPYRNGYYEEGYFTHAYSPIRDESGGIGGVLVAVSENTAEVVATRRNEFLLALDEFVGPMGAEVDRPELQRLLAASPRDLPFTLVYLKTGDDTPARRVCVTGLAADDARAPGRLSPDDAVWPVFRALRGGQDLLLENLEGFPAAQPWPEPPTRAMVMPVGTSCVLIAGLSPRVPLDAAYSGFLARLAKRLRLVVQRSAVS